jgi:uncharacterized hydantoinase/oxoprolinase family protein
MTEVFMLHSNILAVLGDIYDDKYLCDTVII